MAKRMMESLFTSLHWIYEMMIYYEIKINRTWNNLDFYENRFFFCPPHPTKSPLLQFFAVSNIKINKKKNEIDKNP